MAFDRIEADIRRPGVYSEENARGAVSGSAPRPKEVCLIGILGSAATIAEAELYLVADADSGEDAVGRGSMLSHMIRTYKEADPHAELWVCGLDNVTGTKATVDTVFSGTATAAGVVVLRVAGKKISIAVEVGDDATDLGDAIDTAIASAEHTDVPVTSSNTTGTVSWTAKEDGTHGNFIRISVNKGQDESMPAGLALTGGDEDQYLATGATDPDIDTALAVVGSKHFPVVVSGFVDTTNHGKLQDWADAQWDPAEKKEVITVVATCDTFANTVTDGNAENSKLQSMGAPGQVPQTPWVVAAAYAAEIAKNWRNDPNRPMQTSYLVEGQETLYGIDPPDTPWTGNQIETLLRDGLAPIEFDRVGKPQIVRATTTYQTNAAGVPDVSYLDATTILNLMRIFYDIRVTYSSAWPNAKLASDGNAFAPGQVVCTPGESRKTLSDLYEDWVYEAACEDQEGFEEDLSITIGGAANDRLDHILKPRLVQGARVFAFQIGFQLGAA